jgi:hypothetical protein
MESRINSLEQALRAQQKTISDQQRMIDRLKEELAEGKKQTPGQGGIQAAQPAVQEPERTSRASGLFGGAFMTNPYISFALNTFFYSSSTDERTLSARGIPGYTNLGFEQKKGFNISEGELFLFAPVDPYFNLYANIPFTDEGAELEEAYFVTTSLPEGLQIKGGKFKSNFSRFNAQHPHAWDFADAPLAYRAFLNKEGLVEKGAQLTYLPPLPFYTLLGMEVLQGENEVLFNSHSTGGPHALTAYVKSSFDFGKASSVLFGPYLVAGKTRTETVADGTFFRGDSTIYGFEGVYKWRPSRDRSLTLQGEYLWRDQSGSLENLESGSADPLVRTQDGFYVQSLYQMGRWRVGARYDRLSLFADTYKLGGVQEGFKKPWRATAALEFNPSEFSRIRLQYNYDRSGYATTGSTTYDRTNHEVFLQLILGIGAHGTHAY